MKRSPKLVMVAGALALFTAGAASAQIFGQLLKVGGAVLVADKLGDGIDKVINKVTGQNNLDADVDTKVVPILSVGDGKFVGIVQVAGPREGVEDTKAVAQFETRVPLIGGSRAKILIPINARSPTSMKRVKGVGVSAIIDLKL